MIGQGTQGCDGLLSIGGPPLPSGEGLGVRVDGAAIQDRKTPRRSLTPGPSPGGRGEVLVLRGYLARSDSGTCTTVTAVQSQARLPRDTFHVTNTREPSGSTATLYVPRGAAPYFFS